MEKSGHKETSSWKDWFKYAFFAGIGILGVGLGLEFAINSVIVNESTSQIPLYAVEIVATGLLAKAGIEGVLNKK